MKSLLIMRHAKSDWSENGIPDHERPLNARGNHNAPRMGRFLNSHGIHVDLVLSSTAVRARETAEAVIEAAEWSAPFRTVNALYLASAAEWLEVLGALKDDTAALLGIGHNPGVTELVSALAGEFVSMPTAAVAQVELNIDRWSDIAGSSGHRLVNYWYPKGLPAEFT